MCRSQAYAALAAEMINQRINRVSKNKNSPLGRGLSSLLGEKKILVIWCDQKHKIKNLPIELPPGPWQTGKILKMKI